MRAFSVVIAVLVGCGNSSQVGGDSPEAPLRELLASVPNGNANAMRHALVSPDRLRKALDCPPNSNVFRDLTGAREHADDAAKQFAGAQPKTELRSLTLVGQTKISKGDNFRGCKATEAFEVRAYSFELYLAAMGGEDTKTDSGEVIQLDGAWYALLKE